MIKVGQYLQYGDQVLKIDRIENDSIYYTWLTTANKVKDEAGLEEAIEQLRNNEVFDVTQLYTSPMGEVLIGENNAN